MQHPTFRLRRISLPRTRVNKGTRRLLQVRTVDLLIALPIMAMTVFAASVAAAALVC
jgi:hypothetical protein